MCASSRRAEQLAQDAERRRYDPARPSGVDALVERADGQSAADQSAQRGGDPELVVIAAAGVEADDEARRADALGERLDVGRQVVRAALLARLDQHHAAGVRDMLALQRLQRGDAGERGVAIVGAAAAVQLAVAHHRRPRPEPVVPPVHRRLLVEMAVEQHRLGTVAELHPHQRRAPLEPHHLDVQPVHLLRAHPVDDELHRPIHVAVRLPLRIERRRLVRYRDVPLERRHDARAPSLVDLVHQSLLHRGDAESRRPHRQTIGSASPRFCGKLLQYFVLGS